MKSPGHQKRPDHKVEEARVRQSAEVELAGRVIAKSSDVIRVEEDGSPVRFYFPRTAVAAEALEASSTTTQCPFKGTARYFNLKADGRTLKDAVWSYEEPYEEHRNLKDRVAFYDDKYREIYVRISG